MKRFSLVFLFFSLFSFAQEAVDSTHIGPYADYHSNGNIKAEGTYSDKGQKEGIWKHYFESGKLQKIENFMRGSQVGEYKEYYESGVLKQEGKYSPYQTKKEGVWKSYFKNGNLKRQAQYHSNKLCGIYLNYYKNGNVSLKGEYDYFRNTKKGDWIEYYEDGAIKKTEFYNSKGVLESQSKEYYENGNLKEIGDHDYVTGSKDGKWVSFYENGDTLSISYFRKGKQVGQHTEFFENGQKKISCEYDFSGNLHGLYHEIDENGEILQKGNYEEGEKTGKWFIRNDLGELKKIKY